MCTSHLLVYTSSFRKRLLSLIKLCILHNRWISSVLFKSKLPEKKNVDAVDASLNINLILTLSRKFTT